MPKAGLAGRQIGRLAGARIAEMTSIPKNDDLWVYENQPGDGLQVPDHGVEMKKNSGICISFRPSSIPFKQELRG
jgi:hypothetical protein